MTVLSYIYIPSCTCVLNFCDSNVHILHTESYSYCILWLDLRIEDIWISWSLYSYPLVFILRPDARKWESCWEIVPKYWGRDNVHSWILVFVVLGFSSQQGFQGFTWWSLAKEKIKSSIPNLRFIDFNTNGHDTDLEESEMLGSSKLSKLQFVII